MEKRSSNHVFGGKLAAIAIAILGLCIAGTLTVFGVNSAQAVNVGDNLKNCSITMNMPDPSKPGFSNYANMPTRPDGLKYDLYKVAKAVKISGHDAYSFEKLDPFTGTTTDLTNPTASDYDALAQEALAIVKGDNVEAVATNSVGKQASGLAGGMYLVVVHGDKPSGKSDYIVEREFTDASTKESSTKLVSIANSSTYEFSFLPQLIAVPSRVDGTTNTNNTANRVDWQYDVVSTLKPSWNPLYGDLEIVKTLRSYENGKPATFVFEITGYDGNDNVVYSNTASIVFNGAGSNKAVLDHIPAGTRVVVKEVYTGATYELVSPATREETIVAEDTVSVDFENDYNGSGNSGGSVTNSFSYGSNGENASDAQWVWSKDGEEQR